MPVVETSIPILKLAMANPTITSLADDKSPSSTVTEPLYGSHTRFELELEFVTMIGNPKYLQYLAAQKYLQSPAFIAYLQYLRYFEKAPYVQYLLYPGPSLQALQLLQTEEFRRDILRPDIVGAWAETLLRAGESGIGK